MVFKAGIKPNGPLSRDAVKDAAGIRVSTRVEPKVAGLAGTVLAWIEKAKCIVTLCGSIAVVLNLAVRRSCVCLCVCLPVVFFLAPMSSAAARAVTYGPQRFTRCRTLVSQRYLI